MFQSNFLRFHDTIKLIDADDNAVLREKRDAVLRRMRERGLRFDSFNQGSYAMGTGCKPVRSDFDIDVGIVFSGTARERPEDPRTVKRWVRDAVDGHTSNIEWRRHCVRVQYTRQGEDRYHVDLAVYWRTVPEQTWLGSTGTDEWYLAVGKEHSGSDERSWQPAEPRKLIDTVSNHLAGEDRQQFRRVVRYLKRWKDEKFAAEGNAAPVGIGITAACLRWFRPTPTYGTPTPLQYDDLAATLELVNHMRGNFQHVVHEGEWVRRLAVNLPTKPGRDVFGKMSNAQMRVFSERLDQLSNALQRARDTRDGASLVGVFGPDFPR